METATSQLVAYDLFQSFRMGARRIDVLRGISMQISPGEAVFLSGASGADEPTGNLDSKTGDEIINLLLNLVHERNKTLLVVTHDARLAARGDRQLHIKDGVLQ